MAKAIIQWGRRTIRVWDAPDPVDGLMMRHWEMDPPNPGLLASLQALGEGSLPGGYYPDRTASIAQQLARDLGDLATVTLLEFDTWTVPDTATP